MSFERASLGLVLSCLMGCEGGVGEVLGSPQAGVVQQAATSVDFSRSFIITDPTTLAAVNPDFTVAKLLMAENRYLNSLDGGQKDHDDAYFATKGFAVAADDVDGHNAVTPTDPVSKIGVTKVSFNTFRNVILPAFSPADGKEPFKLIAVVNRLDLAGDFDMRGGSILTGAERRWFGEGRLVFSVDDPSGIPMPMTVIMEFRLPALKKVSGTIMLDPAFDFAAGPVSDADWRTRRSLWAQVWNGLSSVKLGSASYLSKLRTILSWIAYDLDYDPAQIATTLGAKNHLSFRTGEQLHVGKKDGSMGALTTEYEYREFYLNGTWLLSTRKLRREPFFCSNASSTLSSRITDEWVAPVNAMAWNYVLGDRNLTDAEIAEITPNCPDSKLPYGQNNDPAGDTQIRAKFTRFQVGTRWAPGNAQQPLTEAQQHDFAQNTCSGCHGAETGTGGFQIAPPAVDGQEAVLSPFLSTSGSQAKPRGQSYTYAERSRRMALVARFAQADPNLGDDPLLTDLNCKSIGQTDCLVQTQ